ncbi:hypothetical protein BP6252_09932 [Coleophoma cylindrospora]|uniref:BZIP domain-containing protein n=1 Tax=Coleophoma cylindrospora TaxID=1849047 RepID=A0A3D8QWZ7_9HELO|nr:hypothetical protein BP6252_09932 [Coleophoma cylindrospora]
MDHHNIFNKYPQDEYALDLLSQAAMHTPDANSTPTSPSFHPRGPNSAVPGPLSRQASLAATRGKSSVEASQQTPDPSGHHKHPNLSHRHHQSHHDPATNDASNVIASVTPQDFNPAALSPGQAAMDTLSFGTPPTRPNLYLNNAFGLGSSQYSSHLGILNAEQFDDGRTVLKAREASEMRVRQQVEAPMPFGITGGPKLVASNEENDSTPQSSRRKKRTRAEINGPEEEDWASKKARGRPRVDTKDETAADRRRTQIRMAQRAYRHRKETTISSLEKKVQDLRNTNEEMSNTFVSLYDFAASKGLLQREPEFGQQLQSTIERILALAKSSTDDAIKEEEQHEDAPDLDQIQQESLPEPRTKGRRKFPTKLLPTESSTAEIEPAQQTWGGYQTVKENTPDQQIQLQVYQPPDDPKDDDDYHIISKATEDNASFPFDFTDIQTYRIEVPSNEQSMQNLLSQSSLPLPETYTFQELTFARRLHRSGLERAAKLIMMDSPPEAPFKRVFGFCLLYETRESIRERICQGIDSSAKDSLHAWRAPFVHLGGAGTHYPIYELNNGLMPKFRTGLSMGPQSPAAAAVRDTFMEDDFRCSLPGFEGEFFDSNDVEGYLRGQGLDISPTADFVTAELDLATLSNVSSTKSSSTESTINPESPVTPITPASTIQALLSSTRQNSFEVDFPSAPMKPIDTPSGNFDSDLDLPVEYSNWNQEITDLNSPKLGPETALNSFSNKDWDKSNPTENTKRVVTISVELLIEEILAYGVCLGRGPGFRPADVNSAIMAAVNASL